MSMYQFAACVDGFNRANGGDDEPQPMSGGEFDDVMKRHEDFIAAGARGRLT